MIISHLIHNYQFFFNRIIFLLPSTWTDILKKYERIFIKYGRQALGKETFFTYLCSSPSVGHKALIMFLHLLRSSATRCALAHERPISSSSVSTVLHQAIFGWPCFLFPDGVHLKAILGIHSGSIRSNVSKQSQITVFNSLTQISSVSLYVEFFIWCLIGPEYRADLLQTVIVESVTLFMSHWLFASTQPHIVEPA